MTKRELFTILFPNEKASSSNRKYARHTTKELQHMFLERLNNETN